MVEENFVKYFPEITKSKDKITNFFLLEENFVKYFPEIPKSKEKVINFFMV